MKHDNDDIFVFATLTTDSINVKISKFGEFIKHDRSESSYDIQFIPDASVELHNTSKNITHQIKYDSIKRAYSLIRKFKVNNHYQLKVTKPTRGITVSSIEKLYNNNLTYSIDSVVQEKGSEDYIVFLNLRSPFDSVKYLHFNSFHLEENYYLDYTKNHNQLSSCNYNELTNAGFQLNTFCNEDTTLSFQIVLKGINNSGAEPTSSTINLDIVNKNSFDYYNFSQNIEDNYFYDPQTIQSDFDNVEGVFITRNSSQIRIDL